MILIIAHSGHSDIFLLLSRCPLMDYDRFLWLRIWCNLLFTSMRRDDAVSYLINIKNLVAVSRVAYF